MIIVGYSLFYHGCKAEQKDMVNCSIEQKYALRSLRRVRMDLIISSLVKGLQDSFVLFFSHFSLVQLLSNLMCLCKKG